MTHVISLYVGHTKRLADFTYKDQDINDIIVSCMANVSIIGVVGSISFEGGDPINDVKIERIQGKTALLYINNSCLKPYVIESMFKSYLQRERRYGRVVRLCCATYIGS